MSHAPSTAIRIALAAALLGCASSGSNGAADPIFVRFLYDEIRPQTVEVPAGGIVAWTNEADDATGYVVFAETIAPSFTCTELGPYFHKSAGIYESAPLSQAQSDQVQLPCPLKPGTYEYDIVVTGSGVGAEEGGFNTLHGRIVVK